MLTLFGRGSVLVCIPTQSVGTSNEEEMKKDMDLEIARHFRDEFRQAREVAYGNAENFQDLLFSLERLGMTLKKGSGNLKTYGNISVF